MTAWMRSPAAIEAPEMKSVDPVLVSSYAVPGADWTNVFVMFAPLTDAPIASDLASVNQKTAPADDVLGDQ